MADASLPLYPVYGSGILPAVSDTEMERFTAEMLVSWLGERGVAVQWERGADPPDAVLHAPGVKVAVEVTRLPLGPPRPDSRFAQEQIDRELRGLTQAIEDAGRRDGVLRGHYLVKYRSEVPDLSRRRAGIVRGALEYMRLTQLASRAEPIVLVEEGPSAVWRNIVQIEKVSNNINSISTCSPVVSRWAEEAEAEVRLRLNDAVRAKAEKLDRGSVQPPRVLLAVSRSPFVNPVLDGSPSHVPNGLEGVCVVWPYEGGGLAVLYPSCEIEFLRLFTPQWASRHSASVNADRSAE